MAICDVCGNDYDKAMVIEGPLGSGTFDSFECAIHALAPQCAHCRCKVIGHGIESDAGFYCCASCARHDGERGAVDRID